MPAYFNTEDLARFAEVGKGSPELFNLFLAWYDATTQPGALDAKTKAIIAVVTAHLVPCPYCIDAWTENALKLGSTPEELAEAIQVAASLRAGATLAMHIQTLNVLDRD